MISPVSIIRNYWIAFTLIILSAITILSLYPVESLPPVAGSDKTHHFIAYATLMFPAALRNSKYLPYIGLFFISWSGMIELVQPYVNRYGEWLDMAANTIGIICGYLIALLVKWVFSVNSKLK